MPIWAMAYLALRIGVAARETLHRRRLGNLRYRCQGPNSLGGVFRMSIPLEPSIGQPNGALSADSATMRGAVQAGIDDVSSAGFHAGNLRKLGHTGLCRVTDAVGGTVRGCLA